MYPKYPSPVANPQLREVSKMEAGQHCTFAVHPDGSVTACGKGSYGRLGLGNSANQLTPKSLPFSAPVKAIASSKVTNKVTIACSKVTSEKHHMKKREIIWCPVQWMTSGWGPLPRLMVLL